MIVYQSQVYEAHPRLVARLLFLLECSRDLSMLVAGLSSLFFKRENPRQRASSSGVKLAAPDLSSRCEGTESMGVVLKLYDDERPGQEFEGSELELSASNTLCK